jgi:hypothetical protein
MSILAGTLVLLLRRYYYTICIHTSARRHSRPRRLPGQHADNRHRRRHRTGAQPLPRLAPRTARGRARVRMPLRGAAQRAERLRPAAPRVRALGQASRPGHPRLRCYLPHYLFVVILLYVSSYYYICVLILLLPPSLCMCRHTTIYICMCPHTAICVLILPHVSSYSYILYVGHTTIHVSSYCYILYIGHTNVHVSSYCYILYIGHP